MSSRYDHIESMLLSGALPSIELGLELAKSQSLNIQPLLEDMAVMVNFLVAHCGEIIVYRSLEELPAILASVDEIMVDYSRIKFNYEQNRGFSLMQVPDKLHYLPNLKSIHLVNVGLRHLPTSILHCRKLTKLDLRENEIWELPDGLETLPLQEVNLVANPLPGLSASILTNPPIKRLYLNGCGITDLDEALGAMQSLEVLAVAGNPLQQLPNSLCELHNLRVLNLFNAQLLKLPQNFGHLQKLEILNLTNNLLRSLPESFGMLPNLVSLGITGNAIPVFPESVRGLSSLRHLSVDGIPEGVELLPALENLSCNWTPYLPQDWGQRIGQLKSLKSIVLSNMGKQVIEPFDLSIDFSQFTHLKRFRVSNLPLTSLPESIQALKGLEYFDATGTELEELKEWRKRLHSWLPGTDIHLTSNQDPNESDILIVH